MWVWPPFLPEIIAGKGADGAAQGGAGGAFTAWRNARNMHSAPVEQGARQRLLLQRLENPSAYPHPVTSVRRIETHISHVFLTGQFAYKIKKPVNLGFLDFSHLEKRAFYCCEEFRLNRRLAPQLYLGVVPISDTECEHCVGSADHVVEYAVKMLEFPQSARLDNQVLRGCLSKMQIDQLADRVAFFHMGIARHANSEGYGDAYAVWADFNELLVSLKSLLGRLERHGKHLPLLRPVEQWAHQQFKRLQGELDVRKQQGFIRECHGDLHLANIAWWPDEPQIFDGIEFSPRLRWVDVASEIAFTSMDLTVFGRPDLAWRFVNRYLEKTGDYAGLKLLTFYEVYRALVRAMLGCIRAAQGNGSGEMATEPYFVFAHRNLSPRKRMLILMHGLSGSGKTTVAQSVLETVGAIRIRSDVERKRLAGLPLMASGLAPEGRLYDADSTYATYHRLLALAELILDAGYPVIVDAASLQGWQREIFRSAALRQGVPFRLLSCRADETVLLERLWGREQVAQDVSDAGPTILRKQQQNSEPLNAEERLACLVVDERPESLNQAVRRLKKEVLS